MPRTGRHQGFTLLECMIAMAVMLIGATGLMGLFTVEAHMTGDARRVTRATAIAQDLLENIELWSYADPRLAESVSGSVTDLADASFQFEKVEDPLAGGIAHHGESSLGTWYGIPTASLGDGYQRFWNVNHENNGSQVDNDIQIAVIVRWRQGGGWRRIVLQGLKLNPARS